MEFGTTTPTGKMIFTVLGAVAELERSLIVERVRVVCGMRTQTVSALADPASPWMPLRLPGCEARAPRGEQ